MTTPQALLLSSRRFPRILFSVVLIPRELGEDGGHRREEHSEGEARGTGHGAGGGEGWVALGRLFFFFFGVKI